MMNPSRRAFLQGAGVISMSGVLLADSRALPILSVRYMRMRNSIEVLRADGKRLTRIQSVASQRPSFLTFDRRRRFLLVANDIDEYQGLPTGSVESYAIQPGSGLLTLIGAQPLSLSATGPRHLAIAPDGRNIVVAAYGGGIYNVLPLDARGELGRVTQAIKEIGSGIHPQLQNSAHPHSVVFHSSGKFLMGSDLGSDRINVFAFERGRLSRVNKVAAPHGSGPGHLWMDSGGCRLFVQHALVPSQSCYQFDADSGALTYVTFRTHRQ